MRKSWLLVFLVGSLVAAGCSKQDDGDKPAPAKSVDTPAPPAGSDGTKPTPAPTPAPAPPADKAAVTTAPTKEAAIARLREVLAALEAKDYEKAATMFAFRADKPPKKLEKHLGRLLESDEISAKGIEMLATNASWGKLAEVFAPERAAGFAEKFDVPVAECYGFSLKGEKSNASVGFHWNGKDLRLIRLNNVGKLAK